jgi:large-conductance mechanosensitive channel
VDVSSSDWSLDRSAASRLVTATNLVDAKKQEAVLAYGDCLTTLIGFLIVFLVLSLVVRAKIALTSSSSSEADKLSD